MSTDFYSYLPNFFGVLLIALLFFLLWLLIAKLLWGKCRARAEKIERENKELQAKYDALKKEVNELEAA